MDTQENLAKLKKMGGLAREVIKLFCTLDQATVATRSIPVNYKESIAVAVAITTQGPSCIEIHGGNARKVGATDADGRGRDDRRRPASRISSHTRDARRAESNHRGLRACLKILRGAAAGDFGWGRGGAGGAVSQAIRRSN